MQTKQLLRFIAIFLLVPIMVACGGVRNAEEPVLTPPAIGVQFTKDNCPSIEVQAGMQVAWTNEDDVDHVLLLERKDANGVLVESGGTDLLQPGTTFSIILTTPGQYTYYCSTDQTTFGTITVLP